MWKTVIENEFHSADGRDWYPGQEVVLVDPYQQLVRGIGDEQPCSTPSIHLRYPYQLETNHQFVVSDFPTTNGGLKMLKTLKERIKGIPGGVISLQFKSTTTAIKTDQLTTSTVREWLHKCDLYFVEGEETDEKR